MEISAVDIKKIKEELSYRMEHIVPEISKAIKDAKAFGDLSDNAEYRDARRQRNINGSRIEYLEKILYKSKIIEPNNNPDIVGYCSRVKLLFEDFGDVEEYYITSTLRTDPKNNNISKQSPLGSAILGKRVNDRAEVVVNETNSYFVKILGIENVGDLDLPIAKF